MDASIQLSSLVARVLLAAILATSAWAKWADRRGFGEALAALLLPGRLLPGLTGLLPASELLVAAALLSDSWARRGALAALVLLAGFTAVIAGNLLRGRRPKCGCFGEFAAAPIGWPTLLRNLVFLALAWQVWRAEKTSLAALFALPRLAPTAAAAVAILLVLLFLQAFLLLWLWRRQEALRRRLETLEAADGLRGLAVGTAVPAFVAPDLAGRRYTVRELLPAGKNLLLVFHDPGCSPCRELLPRLRRWQEELAEHCTVVVIARGGSGLGRAEELPGLLTVWQEASEISALFKTTAIPSAVLVSPEGLIRAPLAIGAAAIAALMASSFPESASARLRAAHRGDPEVDAEG